MNNQSKQLIFAHTYYSLHCKRDVESCMMEFFLFSKPKMSITAPPEVWINLAHTAGISTILLFRNRQVSICIEILQCNVEVEITFIPSTVLRFFKFFCRLLYFGRCLCDSVSAAETDYKWLFFCRNFYLPHSICAQYLLKWCYGILSPAVSAAETYHES